MYTSRHTPGSCREQVFGGPRYRRHTRRLADLRELGGKEWGTGGLGHQVGVKGSGVYLE